MKYKLTEYGIARFAIISPELKVADIEFNLAEMKRAIIEEISNSCSIYLFPELNLTGYSCADLFFQEALLEKAEKSIIELAKFSGDENISIVFGAPIRSVGRLFNCAVFVSCGEIKGMVPKVNIPNSDEYNEKRWFASDLDRISDNVQIGDYIVPFGANLIFSPIDYPLIKIGIEICEDMWCVVPPSSFLAINGANVIFNLSASSEYIGKSNYRKELVKNQSGRTISAYLYTSSGPGESSTDFITSGHCIAAENGNIIAESDKFNFNTQKLIVDIDIQKINTERTKSSSFGFVISTGDYTEISFELNEKPSELLFRNVSPTPFVPFEQSVCDDVCNEILQIQSTALAKRLLHINSDKVVVGLSGGLDSCLAFLVCLKSFEKLNYSKKGIIAVSMPAFGTSSRTRNNAKTLANACAVDFRTIDISELVRLHFKDIKQSEDCYDVVYENAQARIRTLVLMNIANQVGGIVIGTGDLSESALGWATYNGDHMSMYSVNSGVPKSLVKKVIEYAAKYLFEDNLKDVINDILNTPISPELLPVSDDGNIAQETEKIIGSYQLHDFFLYYFFRFGYSPKKILLFAEKAFNKEYSRIELNNYLKLFIKRFFANQYKRSCVPDGIKIGSVSLSPRGDWRMPSDAACKLWIDELETIGD